MRSLRMNLFQRLTLQWDQLHPYNAAQIMRIETTCSPAQIADAWQATLKALGLGRVYAAGRRYEHTACALPMVQLPAGADIEAFASAQMNIPFDLRREGPFRAFLLPDSSTPTIGIIYHHWVADSVSIRVLMREWFRRISGRAGRDTPVPFMASPSRLAGLRCIPEVAATLAQWRQKHRRIRRLEPEAMQDLSVGWRAVALSGHAAMRLLAAAHQHEVKVSDLLMCSIAQVCDRHLPPLKPRRPDMWLGEIRDLRSRLHLKDPDTFGAALAMSTIACPHELLSDRNLLLQHIAAENRRFRALPTQQGVSARLALAAGRLFSRERLLEFYRKRVPVSAGLSNVDLTRAIAEFGSRDRIIDYWRISPTGPIMPLAIAPTTLGARFNISITWRKALFTSASIDSFVSDLSETISAWVPQTLELQQVYEPAA